MNSRYRCVKYWLKGPKQGETEILIDDLPGAPDNINLAPDGSFWIALVHLVRKGWELFVRSKMARHILATFPNVCDLLVNGVRRRATVIKVSEDGKMLRKLDDPDGKVISFLTSAVEFEDHLYLGSLNAFNKHLTCAHLIFMIFNVVWFEFKFNLILIGWLKTSQIVLIVFYQPKH